MSDPSSLLGNFKGVMLCNRPTQIPGSLQAATIDTQGATTRPAFVSRVQPQQALGLPPAKDAAAAHEGGQAAATGAATVSVTQKHRMWLSQFQHARQALKHAVAAKAQRMRDRSQRLAERLRVEREQIRARKEEIAHQQSEAQTSAPAQAPPQSQAQLSHKPSWARTEAEESAHLDAEASALLDFTASLDYADYIEDIEVREALRFVQDRVKNIQKEKQKEDEESKEAAYEPANDAVALTPAEVAEQLERRRAEMFGRDRTTVASASAAGDGGELFGAAARVLADSEDIRHIHSKTSIRAVIDREAATLALTQTQQQNQPQSLSVAAPLVAQTHERSLAHGDSLAQKAETMNLPYLYRHPAI